MMVRLAQLHRVEDVQLNESTAGENEQEPSLAQLRLALHLQHDRQVRRDRAVARGPARHQPRAGFSGRRIVSLTDRDRKLMLALIPVLVLVAYWFLVLAPKRARPPRRPRTSSRPSRRGSTRRATTCRRRRAPRQNFDASYAQVVKLGKAIPTSVDMPSLLVQLDAAAAGTGIRFTKIKAGDAHSRCGGDDDRHAARPPRDPSRAPPAPPWLPAAQTLRASRAERPRRPTTPSRPPTRAALRRRTPASTRRTLRPRPRRRRDGDTAHRHDGRSGPGRAGDGAARARVPGQLLQPRGLLPPREALRVADNDNVVVSGRLVTVEGDPLVQRRGDLPQASGRRSRRRSTCRRRRRARPPAPRPQVRRPPTPAGTTPTDGTTPTSAPTATATP